MNQIAMLLKRDPAALKPVTDMPNDAKTTCYAELSGCSDLPFQA